MAPHAGHRYSGPGGGLCLCGPAGSAARAGGGDLTHALSLPLAVADHCPCSLRDPAGRCPGRSRSLAALDEQGFAEESWDFSLAPVADDPNIPWKSSCPSCSAPCRAASAAAGDGALSQPARVTQALGQALAQMLRGTRRPCWLPAPTCPISTPRRWLTRLDAEVAAPGGGLRPAGCAAGGRRRHGFCLRARRVAAVLWAAQAAGRRSGPALAPCHLRRCHRRFSARWWGMGAAVC